MDVFGKDAIIGDIRLSDMGLMLASFEGRGETVEELGLETSTVEEYIGGSPVPLYLGSRCSSKLQPTVTLVKNPCLSQSQYLDEHECRRILRSLTGFRGYKRFQILTQSFEETYHFNVRTTAAKYQKIGGKVAGIVLELECDSPFAWTDELRYIVKADGVHRAVIYNRSDDLNSYLLPVVSVYSPAAAELSIQNLSDGGRETKIRLLEGETVTLDSGRSLVLSDKRALVGNDFNRRFIRLVPDRNEFAIDREAELTFQYSLPIKVGFL